MGESWSRADLENSLRTAGQMAPIVEYGGIIFDGQRRAELCAALGIKPWRLQCTTRPQMLAALWVTEPARAIKEAGKLSISQYAETFAVSPRVIAEHLRAAKGLPPVKRPTKAPPNGAREIQVIFWCSHIFRALLQHGAQQCSRTLSEYIRSTMEEALAKQIPRSVRASFKRGQLLGKNYRKPARLTAGPRTDQE